MPSYSASFFLDKSLYNVSYSEIQIHLEEIILKICGEFGWNLISSGDSELFLKCPIGFRSFGEEIVINFRTNEISITSKSIIKTTITSWGKNKENCSKFIEFGLPRLKLYLREKESNRQVKNLESINFVKVNIKQFEINKNIFDLISKNQNKIEKKYIPDFLKINQYYIDQVKTHNLLYENINLIDFHKLRSEIVQYSTEAIKVYSSAINLLERAAIEMLNFYLNDDVINFYIIYNQIEDLGLFMTKGEKLIVSNLSELNNNLENIIIGIDNMINATYNLSEKMTSQVSELGNKIDISNFLHVVTAYQVFRLRKN